MTGTALCTILVTLVLSACGGADDDDDIALPPDAAEEPVDASVGPDAPPFVCAASAAYLEPPITLPAHLPIATRGLSRPRATGPGACNAVAQTGCTVGEKCAFVLDDPDTGAGYVGCVVDGSQAIGDACTDASVAGGSDDCTAGGDCYRGVCHEICTTVNDQCAVGACVTFQDALGEPLPIEICLPPCDVLAQNCPGAGDGCYLAGGASVCVGAGVGQLGDSCTAANQCSPGMVCIGSTEGGFVCRDFCGPWMECFDAGGDPVSCACGSCRACGPAELCFAIGDGVGGVAHDIAGVCIPAADSDCDCTATPICPPAS